jgi:aspartate/methionine/tyrosine aminotransferase
MASGRIGPWRSADEVHVVRFGAFKLDDWFEAATGVRWNLGSVAGPTWTTAALLSLIPEPQRSAVLEVPLAYSRAAGLDELRTAIARRYDRPGEEVIITTGASEALAGIFMVAAEPGANVVVPWPSFPPTTAIPQALGLEVRRYHLRRDDAWSVDVEEIASLVDARTRLVLLNSPHNPTGAVIDHEEIGALLRLASPSGIPLVVDEVFHPIYFEMSLSSSAHLGVTVVSDASKAFSLPGLRIGWILEQDPERREAYRLVRMNVTTTCSPLTERLALIAVENADAVIARAQATADRNLQQLVQFMSHWAADVAWTPPAGGTAAFPWRVDGEDATPLCRALLEAGVLTVPGDAFEMPAHFRLGIAAEDDIGPALAVADNVFERVFSGSHRAHT